MLVRSKSPSAEPADPLRDHRQTLRTLHTEMQTADDEKIRQIVGLLDGSPEHHALHAVLDPLRPRLAALRPTRPLRFTRLLFMPLEDLVIPARQWKAGLASIPRSVLSSISDTVRVALGAGVEAIESVIAGHGTNEPDVVARAGALLWSRACDILAPAPPPTGWAGTGLPDSAYAPLARAIATVLRRAVPLLCLRREAELGVLQLNEQMIADVMSNLAGEPVAGRGLVCKLILQQFPQPAVLLERLTNANDTPADRALLQAVMNAGVEDLLTDVEAASALSGSLGDVSTQVQRLNAFMRDLTTDADTPRHRARLRDIREKMDILCRGRFVEGMQEGLIAPLAAASVPVDAAGQKGLESWARDLRSVEVVGRKLGSPAAYDALLAQAGAKVSDAAETGILTRMRAVRLVEILAGPEVAEQLYCRTQPKG
jgi:hypothetical protein